MTANEIRSRFFEFFENKGHKIVPSAPIVNKNDPSLLFTNAGMNQFKDFFLGNRQPDARRVADTQKCLRVSGKHNDLEEVGIDSYHHTMFEMLGNWSFGDYFKKEAIEWAWQLLTEEFKLPKDRLYATIFEGDEADGLAPDNEAGGFWKTILPDDRVLAFDKKDNFWEMGDSGPCGPCSEIHIDLRSEADIKQLAGSELVNKDHPLVVEIWNLVFIQFNRKANGDLEELPDKHVDTGMGFERLCMAVQGKTSNYDTDLFTSFFRWLEEETGKKYEGSYALDSKKDIAFRVVVDHTRAVSFTIADGQLPSNTGAGYVIRRILRRAIRYYYSFLDRKEPLIHLLVPKLASSFSEVFPELKAQQEFVAKIIHEEEKSFLRTLDAGLRKLGQIEISGGVLDGQVAFELYDTYGFPIDLTRLIGQDVGWTVDEDGFKQSLQEQKERSRADAKKIEGDWIEVSQVDSAEFIGYDHLEVDQVSVVKYRIVNVKGKDVYQLVLDRTPFYAESGGQVGDRGSLFFGKEKIDVYDTQKENDLIVHFVNVLPQNIEEQARAVVLDNRRRLIQNNHTATHLMHAALREVLGQHVQQRGSLVNEKHLRFDFSHFEKMTAEQIKAVEDTVNAKIRENISRGENRNLPIEAAQEAGAMMLFGEKYGEFVRMITFDPDYSVELCGGCHVRSTGEIGLFKIKSESAIAAGVRRIEAFTAIGAMDYMEEQIEELNQIRQMFKNPTDPSRQVNALIETNKELEKEIGKFKAEKAGLLKESLETQFESIGEIQFLHANLKDIDMDDAKQLAYSLEKSKDKAVILVSLVNGPKVNLLLLINKDLNADGLDAGKIIKNISKHIQGGGGGQPFFATSGGRHAQGIPSAVRELKDLIGSV